MSMHRCDECGRIVDTDDYPDGWDEVTQTFMCEPCVERYARLSPTEDSR